MKMKPSGILQLLLPVLTLLFALPAAGWKAGQKDGETNRHHLGARGLHSAPNKDGVNLEDLETVSVGERKHVQEAVEAPSSIEDQLRQVNGLEAQTDASFQKAFSAKDRAMADEKSSEDKVLQELAETASVSIPSAPPAGLQSPVHEPQGGLEDLDPAAGGATAPGAETDLAKMSNADRTPIDHHAQVQQSANAPVALPTDKQAKADADILIKYSSDHLRLRPFFEEMLKNGGRDRVTRAEAVAVDIKNKRQAQADATMLWKYKANMKQLRLLYEEMDKNGGKDRVDRAEKAYESIGDESPRTDKTIPKVSQVDKAPIDHHAQTQQSANATVAMATGAGKTIPKISQVEKAPIDHRAQVQQSANALVASATDEQAHVDAVMLLKYSHDKRRHLTYLEQMLTKGGPDRASRAEAVLTDIKNNVGAQTDATMLAKYSSDTTQLRAFYDEMKKNGGQDRVDRAEALAIFSRTDEADKAPIDHDVPSQQNKINAASIVSGTPRIPKPPRAPSVSTKHTQILRNDQQADVDAALLIKYLTDLPRLSSIYAEMRSNGGQDRVNRAEAMAAKMK